MRLHPIDISGWLRVLFLPLVFFLPCRCCCCCIFFPFFDGFIYHAGDDDHHRAADADDDVKLNSSFLACVCVCVVTVVTIIARTGKGAGGGFAVEPSYSVTPCTPAVALLAAIEREECVNKYIDRVSLSIAVPYELCVCVRVQFDDFSFSSFATVCCPGVGQKGN